VPMQILASVILVTSYIVLLDAQNGNYDRAGAARLDSHSRICWSRKSSETDVNERFSILAARRRLDISAGNFTGIRQSLLLDSEVW
jgi:hypothetical protein